MKELMFEELVSRAISEWPKAINLENLENLVIEKQRYTVKGLANIFDLIEERYIGHKQEVLYINLHSTIYTCLLKSALYIKYLELDQLRISTLRDVFEQRLLKAENKEGLNWSESDYILVRRYFEINKNYDAS